MPFRRTWRSRRCAEKVQKLWPLRYRSTNDIVAWHSFTGFYNCLNPRKVFELNKTSHDDASVSPGAECQPLLRVAQFFFQQLYGLEWFFFLLLNYLLVFYGFYVYWLRMNIKNFSCIDHNVMTRSVFLTLPICLLEHTLTQFVTVQSNTPLLSSHLVVENCLGPSWFMGLHFWTSLLAVIESGGAWHMVILQPTGAKIITVIIFYSIFVQSSYSPPGWTRFSGRLMENYDEGQLLAPPPAVQSVIFSPSFCH